MLASTPSCITPTMQSYEGSTDDACEDHHLLGQVATGDQHAFETLYARYTPCIRSYLHRRLSDPENLDEALNDVMMVIWQKAMAFPAEAPVLAWLYGIARYMARTYSRRSDRQNIPLPEFVSEAEEPEVSLLVKDQERSLEQAISKLPYRERQSVELLVYHGCSYKDIAIRLDTPVNTIKSRVMRARTRLKATVSSEIRLGARL